MERDDKGDDSATLPLLELTEEDEAGIASYMAELRAASHLTLPVVLRRLRLDEEDVVAVFLVGSRLWGSASFDSDYDFIIVHRNKSGKPHATLHNGELDASVLHVDEFKRRVEDAHEFYELLCLWLPPEHRWKDAPLLGTSSSSSSSSAKAPSSSKKSASSSSTTPSSKVSFVESLRSGFSLKPPQLFAAIDEETTRDWRMAQKYLEKGNVERARKTVVHALRLLLLAVELARDGRMSRFHAAQRYLIDMNNVTISGADDRSWAHYEQRYRPEFDRLRNELMALCSSATVRKAPSSASAPSPSSTAATATTSTALGARDAATNGADQEEEEEARDQKTDEEQERPQIRRDDASAERGRGRGTRGSRGRGGGAKNGRACESGANKEESAYDREQKKKTDRSSRGKARGVDRGGEKEDCKPPQRKGRRRSDRD